MFAYPRLWHKIFPMIHTKSRALLQDYNLHPTYYQKHSSTDLLLFLVDLKAMYHPKENEVIFNDNAVWSKMMKRKGVDKTRNMEHPGTFRNIPEHPGTSNNYDNYARVTIWSAQNGHVGHVTCSFPQAEQLYFEMNRTEELSTVGNQLKKVYQVTDYWWYFE